ncbi:MAG: ABC transporter substrate-binding protein [Oscillospiraceae bacterium]|nr:ABC transporter substrate-binding protein [Oscillospiraceae bacterium]
MKKTFAMVLAVVMVIGMLAGCGSSTQTAAPAQAATTQTAPAAEAAPAAETAEAAPAAEANMTFKLGSSGPLTGPAAIYGISVMNGIQIAVDEINAMGGLQFEFQSQDDEADSGDKAINAYNTLLDWGMQVMAGTVTSGSGITVAAQAYQDRVFMLTPSGSSVDLIADKDNAFQVCFTDPNQGIASADYISQNFAGAKVAVIYRNDDAYSQGIRDTFVTEAKDKGVEVVYEGTFTEATQTDFSVQLTAAQAAGADLLFLPIYYTPASVILNQANQMGYAPVVFGVDGMDGILTLENFDTSLAEGVMLLTPFAADADDEKTQAFVAEYQKRFGETPNQFAADGYDAAYILKAALEAAGCTGDMSAEEICEAVIAAMPTISVDGITGLSMTWGANGEVSKAPKAVIIQNGVYVSP